MKSGERPGEGSEEDWEEGAERNWEEDMEREGREGMVDGGRRWTVDGSKRRVWLVWSSRVPNMARDVALSNMPDFEAIFRVSRSYLEINASLWVEWGVFYSSYERILLTICVRSEKNVREFLTLCMDKSLSVSSEAGGGSVSTPTPTSLPPQVLNLPKNNKS